MPLEAMEWIWDGIGTELVSLVVGLATGGLGGWTLHKRHVRISMKAGDSSNQTVNIDSMNKGTK